MISDCPKETLILNKQSNQTQALDRESKFSAYEKIFLDDC